MIRALYTAATGLEAQQTNIDLISNNLANINTTAYKKVRAEFKDLGYDVIKNDENEKLEVGLGTQISSTNRLFFQGSLVQTNNPLDLVIDGKGFFKVKDFDGSFKYTRDGSFKLNSDGKIVTSSGRMLEPEITIPDDARDITISQNGIVSVLMPGDSKATEIGTIELVNFLNPDGMKALGDNLFEASDNSGEEISGVAGINGLGNIKQGFLESSNVEVVEEMVNMIKAQRAFEINSKAIEASDDMIKNVNNIRV
jgi:flagellar basal-body rod protein FlgG